MAFAITGQGRDSELESLLKDWEEKHSTAATVWLATLRADLLIRSERYEEASKIIPTLDQAVDEAIRVYIADQRRTVAQALGQTEEVKLMEQAIDRSVDVMVGDSTHLRRALLAGPAYNHLPFLRRPAAAPDQAVRGSATNLDQILQRLEVLRRREPDNEMLAQLTAVQVKAMVESVKHDQVVVHPIFLPHSVLLLVASGGRAVLEERFVDRLELREAVDRLCGLAADPNSTTTRMNADGEYVGDRLIGTWLRSFPAALICYGGPQESLSNSHWPYYGSTAGRSSSRWP